MTASAVSDARTHPVRSALAATLCLSAMLTTGAPVPAAARSADDLSVICDAAAAEAARQTGVPLSVLQAISLTETGRKRGGAFRPWPWTVNMEGEGLWFDTPDEALAYVDREYRRGARSFDVGCFQINYKWHGRAFASVDAMFDPVANAVYAAKFMRDLFAETGSWSLAAGAYHSRNPDFAGSYRARFDRIHARIASEPGAGTLPDLTGPGTGPPDIPEIPDIVLVANGGNADVRTTPRINNFPLLRAGEAGAIGSLVPLGAGGGSLFEASAEVRTEVAP